MSTVLRDPVLSSAADTRPSHGTEKMLRGSSLLLGGRFFALGLNLLVQILAVRYLAKSDYGAFAYALGMASLGSSAVLLGLDKAIPSFIPIYQDRGDRARTFGTILLAIGTVAGLGIALVLLVFGLRAFLLGHAVQDPLALSLLVILIALAPVQALDSLLLSMLALFLGARAVVLRKHLLGPTLKLAAVCLVMATSGSVEMLAYAYLAGGIIGVSSFAFVLFRSWQAQGLLRNLEPKLPARELYGYAMPLLSSELLLILRDSIVLIFLESFQSTTAVAEFRAVAPLSRLNLVVMHSFSILAVPLAARLFARSDREGMNQLYWRTALWIAVLGFPVFAMTSALATPVTVLVFGARYADSAVILAILAVGHYTHAALGFNLQTLRITGRVRYIFSCDVAAAVIGVSSNLLLIPRYGAMGAAIATASTFILHNALLQFSLHRAQTGIRPLDARYVWVYGVILLALGVVLSLQAVFDPPIYVGIAIIAGLFVGIVRLTRNVTRAADTFPELLRIPAVRWLLT